MGDQFIAGTQREPKQSPTTNMAPITGTYTQKSRENYEEMLKAIGVGMLLRKAAMASSPVMTISETGGNWTVLTKTTAKTTEVKFRMGEEFDETSADGRTCKTLVVLDGDTMTSKQKAQKSGEKDLTVVRQFTDSGFTMKSTCDGVTATQVFTRN